MSQAPSRSAEQIRRGLEYLCTHVEYVRSAIAKRPFAQRAAMDRLTDEHAAAPQVAADLEAVHLALRSSGDALGIFGRVRSMVPAPGVDVEKPTEPVLRCPRHYQCDRFAQPGAGAESLCELTGAALNYGELSP